MQFSEKLFHSLTLSVKDAIVVIDEEGLIQFFNQGACTIFGFGEEEVLGKSVVLLMPEHHRAAHTAGLLRIREGGAGKIIGQTVELTARCRDGHEFPMEMSLSTWTDDSKRYYVALIRDITTRKEAEKKLQQHTEELERLVRESTRQLIHADRLATLGTFAAGVAHEINNPNSFISGNVAFVKIFWQLAKPILLRHSQEDASGRVQGHLEEIELALEDIEKGSLRIGKMVDTLKGYAKGGGSFQKRKCSLRHAMEDARDLLQHRLKHGGFLELSLVGDFHVLGDVQQLSQVFINLFNNALDAMEGAGMVFGKKIYVRTTAIPGHVLIRVGDNGPGIGPQAATKIFDPFFTTKGQSTGTGLGLSIVKGIIEEHGGGIVLANHPSTEGGAEFQITLPLIRE